MIIEINKNNIDLINNSFISKEYILNELKIDKVLITKIEDSLSLFEKIVYKASNRNKQIILNNPKFYSIDRILKNSRYQLNYTNPYTKDEVATICRSSGSEGIPKTLPSTNENINFISLQHQISEIDYTKVANIVLDEFRNGKIGNITLEEVE